EAARRREPRPSPRSPWGPWAGSGRPHLPVLDFSQVNPSSVTLGARQAGRSGTSYIYRIFGHGARSLHGRRGRRTTRTARTARTAGTTKYRTGYHRSFFEVLEM